ncbi:MULTISPECIES: VOC family protein [Pontibacillus]|uniref:VOC family protein n=1 Tax=Pontibacillus chungwhensis TaxID=265426 RepID=A0ABY8UWJ4_9BACI|nr:MULTISPECIES: VOC family protein [Pontibacillus]MCD5323410.1 VOC family protein [Pontibacillus sp. HN14]WIF96790.1 VOC family protein [Pontibacillus chungwhensis]
MDFDHLVVLAKSPEKSQQDMKGKHGIRGQKGGEHKEWGTYNHLAFFENGAYIEWIGITDYEKASQSDNPLIQQALETHDQEIEGPFTFALRTSQMDELIEHWEAENLNYEGPFKGSRTTPDGQELSWRMLFPKAESAFPLPFIIEWGEKQNGPTDPQDLNSIPFETIHVGVQDLEAALHQWTLFYQLGEPEHSQDLAGNPSYEWKLGNGTLSLSEGEGINGKFGHINL